MVDAAVLGLMGTLLVTLVGFLMRSHTKHVDKSLKGLDDVAFELAQLREVVLDLVETFRCVHGLEKKPKPKPTKTRKTARKTRKTK